MDVQVTDRGVPKARFNSSRFFHVVGEGWYLEAREGPQGPFNERGSALVRLEQIMEQPAQPRTALW